MSPWTLLTFYFWLTIEKIASWGRQFKAGAVVRWHKLRSYVVSSRIGRWIVSKYYQWEEARRRKQKEKTAYEQLLQTTGYTDGDPADVANTDFRARMRAEARTKELAADIAEQQEAAEEESIRVTQEESFVAGIEGAYLTKSHERLAKIQDRPTAREVEKQTLLNLTVGDRVEKLAGATDSINVSSVDAHITDMRDSASVVPPPRRSEIQHKDLQVYGAWEENPNSHEKIQEAAQFPMMAQITSKTVEHLITSNMSLQGPEDQTDIIRQWLEIEMEYSSGYTKSLERLVTDIATQMIKYGSAVIFKQRTRSDLTDSYRDPMTGGKRNALHSISVPDMATVQAFIDRRGRPRKWRQFPHLHDRTDKTPTYPDRDVLVARLPQRASAMNFWTPALCVPVFYAIQVMNDLHDTIESHTKSIVDIPSFAQVGDGDYMDGVVKPHMLDQLANTVQSSKQGKMLIVPWYVNLSKHETKEYVDQLVTGADFWKSVIREGIGGSQLDEGQGESSNRATADVLDEKDMRFAQALVPEIQFVFRSLFVDKLLEKGYTIDQLRSHKDMVSLEFEDIDLSSQMARESHLVFIFQNDGITHGEFRTALGEDPVEETADMFYSDIQMEVQKEITEHKNAQKEETAARVRPGGKPKPKRKKDAIEDGREAHNRPIV